MDGAAAQAAVQSFDLREHVEKKGMWAGLTTRTQIPGLSGVAVVPGPPDEAGAPTYRLEIRPIKNEHTPALLKSFDELIVNASDHAVECAAKRTQRKHSQVTFIRVVLDPASGAFQITNDGPGLPVVPHAELSARAQRPVYVPEIAFFHLLSGSNMVKAADNVKGGINGVGAKIGFINSARGEVTTVSYDTDGSKRLYAQSCGPRMRTINPPVVLDLKKDWGKGEATQGPVPTPHTSVTIHPVYPELGYGHARPGAPGGQEAWKAAFPELHAWLLLRCCQLAAYVGAKVAVTLNGFLVPTVSAEALADLYFTSTPGGLKAAAEGAVFRSQTALRPKDLPYKKHPWTVSAIVSPSIKKFAHVSVVNGVVSSAGNHIGALREQIRDAVVKRLHSLTKDKANTPDLGAITKNLQLVIVGALPGADWTGQRKDELTASKAALGQYKFTAVWLKELADQLCGAILSKTVGKGKAKKSKPDKYTPAKSAGVRKGGPAADLLLAEGDSAITLLREGLTLGKKNPGGPSFQTHGIFSLGGVPMNAAKKITEVAAGAPGETVIVRKTQLEDNKVLSALNQILNLDFGKKYGPGPAGDAEFKTLRYKTVVFCFDADVDGSGKIAGLMLMYFFTFWPGLIRRGFIKWFMTPVIRVYPKGCDTEKKRAAAGALKEFYLEQQFEEWCEKEGGGANTAAKRYKIMYYKGLGGHEKPERPLMFKDFEAQLYTFGLDEHAAAFFEIYFGVPTGPRKLELSSPQEPIPPELLEFMLRSRSVPCSAHMRFFAKPYKLDALSRQLPGALDSFTVGRRKAVAAARQRKGECQTFQMAAYAADQMSYHHGGASMEGAFTRLCQNFPGARIFPFMLGSGSFGSWVMGGKDAASPRYTKVSLNRELCDVMLPRDDDPILDYEFVDGVRAEPKTYVPIICCTACDNLKIPTEGWNYNCFPRLPSQVIDITWALCDPRHPNHRVVLELVKAFGTADYNERLAALRAAFPLDVALLGVERDLRPVGKGKEIHHFGRYVFESVDDAKGAKVRVVALPYRVWSETVRNMLSSKTKEGDTKSKVTRKSSFVEDVNDYSGADSIDIEVLFKPGALAKIKAKYNNKEGVDPMENFLGLHTGFGASLNVIQPVAQGQGAVLQFDKDYHGLVAYHLPIRMRYYKLRFERIVALLEAEIRMERETLRFIPLSKEVAVNKIDDVAAAGAVLDGRGFPRIFLTGIRSPKFATVDEIRKFVVEPSGGAAGAGPDEDEEDGRPSYTYILNLRERDKLTQSVVKRQAKLVKLEEDLAKAKAVLTEQPFPAASVWRSELEKLVGVMHKQGIFA